MGRRPTGSEALPRARRDIASAQTVQQLRTAQAVVLPLDFGLTLQETAAVIGQTPGWVARTRVQYIKATTRVKSLSPRGGRRNNLLTIEEERQFVERANGPYSMGRQTAPNLLNMLELRFGREVALSTAYNMMHRVKKIKAAELQTNQPIGE